MKKPCVQHTSYIKKEEKEPRTTHVRTYIVVVECGEDGGVVVSNDETGAAEPLGLVDQHVAPSVVCVIGHHHTS